MARSPEYARAPVKLMIVGQETNKWYSRLHDLAQFPSATAIQNKYSEFALGVGYKNSPFWRAATHRITASR
jgi:hypothetical protein